MQIKWFSHRVGLQILLASSLAFMQFAWGQDMNIKAGMYLNITSGAMLKVDSMTVQSGAGATLGSGASLFVGASLANSGSFVANPTSTLNFTGTGGGFLAGITTISNLTISGNGLTLNNSLTVNGALSFTSGKITLGSNDLIVGTSGSLSGASASSYVVTNGTGVLKRAGVGATSTQFPVGTVSTYNPVTITNAGAADSFSVRVQPAFDNVPPDPNRVVNRQWTIAEAVAGGSNANISLQWNSVDQAPGFTTGQSIAVGHYTGTQWLEAPAALGGSGPFTATVAGITSFSPFAVGDTGAFSALRTNVRVMLQGPYNTGTHQMDNTLRTNGTLAAHFGPSVPTNAVDSITVEIRNAPTSAGSTIRLFQPAWLLKDGTIVNFADTTRGFTAFSGAPSGSYYVVIWHRNHLTIMSATAQPLTSATPVAYDFTLSQSQAYGSNPMVQVSAGVFALYAGDANASGIVTSSDANGVFSSLLAPGYNPNDINLSGVVSTADANIIFANLLVGSQVSSPERNPGEIVPALSKQATVPHKAR